MRRGNGVIKLSPSRVLSLRHVFPRSASPRYRGRSVTRNKKEKRGTVTGGEDVSRGTRQREAGLTVSDPWR